MCNCSLILGTCFAYKLAWNRYLELWFEIRGDPPDPCLNGCTEIRGGPPIPGPLPTRGGGILICQSGNEIRGGPPVPGPPPMQGGTTLICRCSFEIRGGPPVPGLPPRQGGKTLMHRYSSEIRGGPPVRASAMQGDLGTVPRR